MRIDQIFKVEGKGVLVTGGASGLGLGYAEALACNGARVTLLDMHADRLAQETARLMGADYDVRSEVVDIRDHAALDAAVDRAAKLYGRLDAVFANAGIAGGAAYLDGEGKRVDAGAIENYADERWNGVIDVNLNGVFATLRSAARIMKPQRSGRIIVTTSLAAVRVAPHVASAYYASKAAAAHLAKHAALELAAYNICVNCIAPGWFVTNIGGGHAHDPAAQAAVAKRTPLHRVGLPSDMAGLAIFLTSDASSYVTGQQIVIDGGAHLGVAD
jgi:NAD(P)-dependent dehydrogenase (short-subunit alcohol dehydrogenase family)